MSDLLVSELTAEHLAAAALLSALSIPVRSEPILSTGSALSVFRKLDPNSEAMQEMLAHGQSMVDALRVVASAELHPEE